jgi:hypothetical protein
VGETSEEGVEVMTVTMARIVLFVVRDDVGPFSTDSTVGVSDESKKTEDVTVNAMTGTWTVGWPVPFGPSQQFLI